MGENLKIQKISCKEMVGWAFIGINLIMLMNSLRLCFSSDIWYDELFTMGMVGHSYGELIGFTARDVHPPLYYFIAKFVLDLCKLIVPSADSVIIVKIVSVMPYFLLFIYSLTFLRKKFGIFVSGVFMFCILAMPQMSAYTVEMRMYGWALFFVTATFFHAYEVACGINYNGADAIQDSEPKVSENLRESLKEGKRSRKWKRRFVKNYVAILLYGLAAAYIQYFACVAVIMVYLYLLIWILVQCKKFKKYRNEYGNNESRRKADGEKTDIMVKGWGVCVGLSILGYLPWLFVLISQITAIRDNYWILPLTWRSIGGCVKFIMKPAFQKEGLNVILAVWLFSIYVALLIVYGFSARKVGKAGSASNTESADNMGSTGFKSGNEDGENGVIAETTAEMTNATFYYALAGCLVLCGLVAFGFIASIVIRPVFVYRYMLPAMGCFWLCFVLCLDNFCRHDNKDEDDGSRYAHDSDSGSNDSSNDISSQKNSLFKKVLFCLPSPYIYLITIILVVGIRDYRAFSGEEEYRARLMEETALAFSDIAQDDIILYNFDQLQAVCGYYMDQENYLWNAAPEPLIVDIFGNKGSVWDTTQIRKWLDEGRTVWFFGSFNSRENIRLEWEEDGIVTKELGSYMLERYWFNIYGISLEHS